MNEQNIEWNKGMNVYSLTLLLFLYCDVISNGSLEPLMLVCFATGFTLKNSCSKS